MNRLIVAIICAIAVLPGGPRATAQEQNSSDIESAVTSGTANVGLRYRYEFVDQDFLPENANASTLLFRLNYRTAEWRGWSAFGEFDHVFNVLLTDFNAGGGNSPDKAGVYPVVADPKGSDLNQLYADYTMDEDWKFRFGRQRIVFDNQRFVGGVAWRQNEQTFDALTLNTNAISNTALQYTYVSWVRRIFGQKVDAGKAKVDGHLFNADVTLNSAWSVVPYFYYLDYDAAADAASSTATLGGRLAGNIGVGKGNIKLVGEFAAQTDVGNNPASYNALYWHFDANWALADGWSLGVGFESLGSDDGESFRTPLATLHIFQGWADKFLTTPDAGIDDLYLRVGYKWNKWDFTGIYHDFSAESGGGDFGTELDFSAAYEITDSYSLLLKSAFFSTDDPVAYDDTTKIWIMLTAKY
jgi:hypothetical protein